MRKRKYDPTKFANILARANSSALTGLPISYALNIVIVIPLTLFMVENEYSWMSIAMVIAIPFYVASMLRMVTIDWIWFQYKINIDPKHLLIRLYNHLYNMCCCPHTFDMIGTGFRCFSAHGTRSPFPK